jgi:hypothetical protein
MRRASVQHAPCNERRPRASPLLLTLPLHRAALRRAALRRAERGARSEERGAGRGAWLHDARPASPEPPRPPRTQQGVLTLSSFSCRLKAAISCCTACGKRPTYCGSSAMKSSECAQPAQLGKRLRRGARAQGQARVQEHKRWRERWHTRRSARRSTQCGRSGTGGQRSSGAGECMSGTHNGITNDTAGPRCAGAGLVGGITMPRTFIVPCQRGRQHDGYAQDAWRHHRCHNRLTSHLRNRPPTRSYTVGVRLLASFRPGS